jgi:hypothetical protein
VAIGTEVGSDVFFEISGSGLSTLDSAIAAMHRGAGWVVQERAIEQITLAEVCRRYAPADIHILKIDAEGGEYAALLRADFNSFRPWIILAEATRPLSQEQSYADWEPIVVSAGYCFAWFDGLNRFYIANERWERLCTAFVAQPNVFDDFIRATDTEHLHRIVDAEARVAAAEIRLAEANVQAGEAEKLASQERARAADAEARAQGAAACATQAETRAQSSEKRAAQAAAPHKTPKLGLPKRQPAPREPRSGQQELRYAPPGLMHESEKWKQASPI